VSIRAEDFFVEQEAFPMKPNPVGLRHLLHLLVVSETLLYVYAMPSNDLLDLIAFIGPALSTSAAMTALALNAGSKKAADWFYLDHAAKSGAARSIKYFEEKTRISLSQKKAPFFCNSILYLQGAASAMQKESQKSIATPAVLFNLESVSATVSDLLASYPTSTAYGGYCVKLFPSPNWKAAAPPCEGTDSFPNEDQVAGVALFSLKCLAASDFDWREISSGYRPGGVSAMSSMYAQVAPFSAAPVCSEKKNTNLIHGILGMIMQSFFTQLMVAPVSALLTMEVKEICSGGFENDGCLRFENVIDLFFESFDAARNLAYAIETEATCLFLRAEVDPFGGFKTVDSGGH